MEKHSDASESLSRFHAADEELLTGLYLALTPSMRRLARSYALCDADVEDLVHETWAEVLVRRRSLGCVEAVRAWTLRICRTVCRRWQASRAWLVPAPGVLARRPTADVKSEAEAWLAADFVDDVLSTMLRLPERQRLTVIYRVMHSESVQETARTLGCCEGTVKAALHQGLHSLRRKVAEPPCEL